MGIRGLIVFIIADKRHAYYNQMDSYPEGLGQDIVNFILSLNPEQWDEMAKKLEEVTVLAEDRPNEELQAKYSELEYNQIPYLPSQFQHRDVSTWHKLLLGIRGAPALYEVFEERLKHLPEHDEGVMSFVEWVYTIDFDKRTLETWSELNDIEPISFEDLRQLGEKYMERIQKVYDEEYAERERVWKEGTEEGSKNESSDEEEEEEIQDSSEEDESEEEQNEEGMKR